jgi:hypothetical protein
MTLMLVLNLGFACQMTSATDGSDFSGTVTVYVTIDGGTQAIGIGRRGRLHGMKATAYYSYGPSAAETDGASCAFTFIGTGAVTGHGAVRHGHAAQTTALQSATGPRSATSSASSRMRPVRPEHLRRRRADQARGFDAVPVLAEPDLSTTGISIRRRATRSRSPCSRRRASTRRRSGPSGDWVLPARPPSIQGVAYDVGGGIYQKIYTTDDPNWWAAQQSILTGPPAGAYYEAAEPNGKLYFNNIPAAATNIRLQLRTYFGRVALTDVLVLPPGYESALTLTLMEAIAEPLHAPRSRRR